MLIDHDVLFRSLGGVGVDVDERLAHLVEEEPPMEQSGRDMSHGGAVHDDLLGLLSPPHGDLSIELLDVQSIPAHVDEPHIPHVGMRGLRHVVRGGDGIVVETEVGPFRSHAVAEDDHLLLGPFLLGERITHDGRPGVKDLAHEVGRDKVFIVRAARPLLGERGGDEEVHPDDGCFDFCEGEGAVGEASGYVDQLGLGDDLLGLIGPEAQAHLGSEPLEVVEIAPREEDELVAIGAARDVFHCHGLRDAVPVESEIVATLVALVMHSRAGHAGVRALLDDLLGKKAAVLGLPHGSLLVKQAFDASVSADYYYY